MTNSHRMGGKPDATWKSPYTVAEVAGKGRYTVWREVMGRSWRSSTLENILNITVVAVQLQRSGTDCGTLAIAFAYHAVVGDNLATTTFDQSQIRQQLAQCYLEMKLSRFPQQHPPVVPRPIVATVSIGMHCKCGQPDSIQDMITCDSCNQWFHLMCGGVFCTPADCEYWFCCDCR